MCVYTYIYIYRERERCLHRELRPLQNYSVRERTSARTGEGMRATGARRDFGCFGDNNKILVSLCLTQTLQ